MRIQLASDLHLEFLSRDFPQERLVAPVPGVDVLVLAGDIAHGSDVIELFADWPAPHVLYVAGNHEFYGASWEAVRANIKAAALGSKVTFLDNEAVELDGIRFLGTTLWTDFRLDGRAPESAMALVERTLADYTAIRTERGPLRAVQTQQDHEKSRAWLDWELAKPFAGKTVVITHHAPHPLSIHPRYGGDPVNAGFVSNLTALLLHADLWLHGHVHDSFDYSVGPCRVVANPAGYVLNRRNLTEASDIQLENRAFNRSCVLDI